MTAFKFCPVFSDSDEARGRMAQWSHRLANGNVAAIKDAVRLRGKGDISMAV